MNFIILLLQLEKAGNKLLDYGLLGIIVMALAYFMYRMWEQIKTDQAMWRNEAIKGREAFIELSQQQQVLSQKLIAIRERDVNENREFHGLIRKKIEDWPAAVRKELRNELNEQKNLTSTG